MISLYYGCEQDMASRISKEIAELRQGQVGTLDLISMLHELFNDLAEATLKDFPAHENKPTVKDIFHPIYLDPGRRFLLGTSASPM
jgi:hypothetical protein